MLVLAQTPETEPTTDPPAAEIPTDSGSDTKTPDDSNNRKQTIEVNNDNSQDQADEDEEEEEGECGFCLFMKGGGCKDKFVACVRESESKNEDLVEKCFEVTSALKKCMEAHSDYYEPILRAEEKEETEEELDETNEPVDANK